ncbi:MAG: FAD-binding protein [Candidatus Methanofastidiosia archaeon]
MRIVKSDVLIVGSGGAGVRAAIEAHNRGADVLIIAKTLEGKAHTVMAEGGINAAIRSRDSSDSWEEHLKDTVGEGVFLNNQKMVEILAQEAIDRVYDLERFGAVFDRTSEGKIAQRPFGGQSHPRTCYVGDETGHELIMALVEEARHLKIRYMSEIFITALLVDKIDSKHIAGAFGIDMHSGDPIIFRSKTVIVATGGAGRVYKITSNPQEATGDGYAMALRIGATLQDMEQTQFHPTGMVFPDSARGILVTEAVRGEGGMLLNKNKYRFMKDYNPEQMELSPRDQTARAIYTEIESGRGTSLGGVYLDITHKGKNHILEKIPRMVKQFKKFANKDITTTPMEVAPTAHHFMGGVRVDPESCESTEIRGLFVCGESAAGLHGANRLGGNALAETQVFGKRAGEAAAKKALKFSMPEYSIDAVDNEIARIEAPFFSEGNKPQYFKHAIQEIMWRHAGIVRNEALLREGLDKIRNLGKKPVSVSGTKHYNLEWHEFIEVQNMILVSQAVILSALERKESRGAHYRSDYPKRDDSTGLVNITVSLRNDSFVLDSTPVVITKIRPTKRRGD